MPAPPRDLHDDEALRYQWATLAALLRQTRILDGLGTLLLALALLAALAGALAPIFAPHQTAWRPGWPWQAGLGLSMAAALVQKYHALRCALDAELFDWLARQAPNPATAAEQLDTALVQLRLRRADHLPPRDWPERQRAALALLRRQGLWLLLQAVTLLGSFCWLRH
ncbi:hypothetical protein D8I35_13125 [Corticibacter populi]|uniref:Uncharacterized protein n=1 Tax=Corticibacter populi TaxID=1550736 RepID=A0A3M6QP32_9BURK|nr:hypothetical protein [Corticibacter populi]RMX04806.1 hypothetical protein D8I35_13125 [Corticibacter populi]RZS33781.1 hypothetical protein EV687_2108 [Corticibacter populi]